MGIQTFSALLVEHTSKPYKCSFNNLVYQKIPGGGLPDPLVGPLLTKGHTTRPHQM